MLKKIYIHNYRCLQNFEINLNELNSALILGRNGSGKSSLFDAIEIFQEIGQGTTQLKDLINKQDFTFGDTSKPMLLEIQAELNKQAYHYRIEIEWPANFRQPRVNVEKLCVDGKDQFKRDQGKTLLSHSDDNTAEFTLDWHHIGLPLISTRNEEEPIALFRRWLSSILVLSPVPASFHAISKGETLYLQKQADNTLDWLRYLLAESPASYNQIIEFIRHRMPDFDQFKFEVTGKDEKELLVRFHSDDKKALELNFSQLSDGEKIYFLTASILAAIGNEKSILCLWDEPDNYVSLPELSHFIAACRKVFENNKEGSQLLISTHNARAINEFSDHNTFILTRQSHLHPTRVQQLDEKVYLSPTLIDAYENGELD